MKASTAAAMAKAHKRVNFIIEVIERTAKKGKTQAQVQITEDGVRDILKDLGYHLSDEIDCENNYRGTYISW